MKNIMTIIAAILFVAFIMSGCGQNNTKQKELELKEKELALKERELALNGKEIALDNAKKSKTADNETPNPNKVPVLVNIDISKKPTDIKKLIAIKLLKDVKNIQQSCSLDKILKGIDIQSISLNPNGQQYIVTLWGCNGTDDCGDCWIYEYYPNNNLRLLGDLECGKLGSFKTHNIKTNGYSDFEASEVSGGTMTIYTSFYKFNGIEYKRTSFSEKPYRN